MESRVHIFDTTLRDGEQSPGYSMNLEEKLQMADQLEKLRVDVIEAGFPIASDGDFIAVKKVAERITECSVAGLCRTKKQDIDRAWEALQHAKYPRIHTFIATSDIHMKYKLKKSRVEVLESAVEAVKYAKSYCDDVEFSAEDASRSDREFLYEVFTAVIDAGATVINVPDTVGYAMPTEFGDLIKGIKENVPNIDDAILSVHCHNDLGVAVANSIMALQNGAQQVECTINGIGERAGNASLEEIVMAIRTRQEEFEQDTRIQTEEIFPASKLLAEITGNGVQRNKAVVGDNAFAHEAGIHQDGVLKNPMTYEIMTPQSVGIPKNKLVLGKHSGRHALKIRLGELGFDLSKKQVDQVYKAFINLADEKKIVKDDELKALASNFNGSGNGSSNGDGTYSKDFSNEKIQDYMSIY
ncbi:MAG: 2-isopropylmalate synthase [Candidatus Marinimicrobia bacterium]|nr:2-isopropylmalate synthase [Candidatus Neomarinimicrobiota bacterium]MCF7828673.1 2-isopropylmalate synthase [Candidatus Neomarinimicrobiota bacterium]MCF7880414.1 2-isopropylmalate synthase [Candidatus Neomarinimicrobiota bacterium]